MINSISFYPAVIAVLFLVFSILMIMLDYSEAGKKLKTTWSLLRLRDASTARSIISAIAAGIISLTVFSFSMVMIVLNQAASKMSNRILDKLIGNRFQQFVLGFYIGTIVYPLFLLSTIRDIDSGIYVPSLSTYLLIALTVADIFLFIYFLHYITQSVKYEIIISRIHHQTKASLEKACRLHTEPGIKTAPEGFVLNASKSGLFSGFNKEGLLHVLKKKGALLSFHYSLGNFVLKDTPFVTVTPDNANIDGEWKKDLFPHLLITQEEFIDDDFTYGFRQLTEVAVKALSPGENDPGTAIAGLHALADLLAYRLTHYPANVISDEEGRVRIITNEAGFEQLFNRLLLPIWDYGKKDRMLQQEMQNVLLQLQCIEQHPAISKLLLKVHRQILLDDE